MAIQYIKENYVRRSKGHNAVEHSAKRSCSKLSCYRTGKTFDFSDRMGCVYSEILLPETAYNDHFDANNHPLNDRQELWNAIEEVEDAHNMRKTAQLALELQIALPNELKINQNIELINSFISKCSFPESTSYEIKKTILSSDRIFISKQDVFGNNVYSFKDLLKN